MDETNITPELRAVTVFLHELGHVSEFMDYEDNPEEYKKRQAEDSAALPFPRVHPAKLAHGEPSSVAAAQSVIDQDPAGFESRYGHIDPSEYGALQYAGYASMRNEEFADNFASKILLSNPMLHHPGPNDPSTFDHHYPRQEQIAAT